MKTVLLALIQDAILSPRESVAITFFDSHDYVKRLEESGIPTAQAEAHAKALAEAMNSELVKKQPT